MVKEKKGRNDGSRGDGDAHRLSNAANAHPLSIKEEEKKKTHDPYLRVHSVSGEIEFNHVWF